MKNFRCHCGQVLFFENTFCNSCKRVVAYDPVSNNMIPLEPEKDYWAGPDGQHFILCKNAIDHAICNWLTDDKHDYCISCRMNKTIPNLEPPQNLQLWKNMEAAKRHLVYSLRQKKLPIVSKQSLAFAFLEDKHNNAQVEEDDVKTGYANGLITLNLAEADNVKLERQRQNLGEQYRTLLGHFRHESGHYYFDQFIRHSDMLKSFRDCFGDEREQYDAAIARYYQQSPQTSHPEYISTYAQAHPLEDWAETWAHYLHMSDALETAACHQQIKINSMEEGFDKRISSWMQLSVELNALNRSLGLRDAYPFVLSPTVIKKLGFIETAIKSIVKIT